jgi:hypothetical protein
MIFFLPVLYSKFAVKYTDHKNEDSIGAKGISILRLTIFKNCAPQKKNEGRKKNGAISYSR